MAERQAALMAQEEARVEEPLVVERRAALVAQEEERYRQPRFPLVD